MEKSYMTIEEFAKIMKVSERTIRTWVKDKGLPSVKIGNVLRFDEAAVEKWIKEQNENE